MLPLAFALPLALSGSGFGLAVDAAQGRAKQMGPLDDLRDEVHNGGNDSNDDSGGGDDDDDDSGGGGCWLFCGGGGGGGGGGGSSTARVHLEMSRENWPHPYFDGAPGYYLERDEVAADGARRWNIRAHSSAAYVLEGLWRVGAGARIGAGFFEFDTAWDWFYDPVTVDALTIGDFNLAFSPVRGRHFALRAGAGARVMFDSKPAVPGESGPAAGFNAMAGLTIFPARPLVVSADFDVGTLGGAFMWRAGGRLGVMMGPLEVFGGADHTRIGALRLTGVNFGFAAWF